MPRVEQGKVRIIGIELTLLSSISVSLASSVGRIIPNGYGRLEAGMGEEAGNRAGKDRSWPRLLSCAHTPEVDKS